MIPARRRSESSEDIMPYDPEPQCERAVMLAHVNQSAPDIRKKLLELGHLAERSIRALVTVTERVYNRKESVEGREIRKDRC